MDATPYMALKRPYPFEIDHAPMPHYEQPQYARGMTSFNESLRLLGSVRLMKPD